MNWFEAAFLGLIQGLTEFLPISSSAHLRIVGELLPGASDPGAAFTAITQLGTETAVLVFFWKDIVRIIGAWFNALRGRIPHSDPDAKMGWLIIVGSIPIGVLGLLFEEQIDTSFRSLWIVATTLVVFGLILAVADYYGKQDRELVSLTPKHGILFGFAQALALIPGVSRSGGTITAGLFMGYTRGAAARYSFLLAIPAVFASGLYKLAKSLDEPGVYSLPQTGLATLIAFIVGFVIVGWFLKYVSSHSYSLFVWYRVALGLALYLLLGFGVINA
ncbi:undecaprenyl-diphosphate phosphatase [Paeniglutamicibacter psychrophenolicus]|uniref:undecaprenyl-diphosphate phosphatase n=1 Tax=Paeniglutamicibacter psychrophenolicus TaxID=257454 RepID=UPI002782C267|nr:undecaprenyl-diphosphate phosphatase [Paeniglutamicibacter psychrophenolicus]MDQ0093522.1 undecaprenyl-diphosphatase [Paeniglutamicibacter psychrophenolicus]